MLERASACLDSGVRLSLRATQRRAPKSRRLLHSHFWHHAAADLDLPTCQLPSTCPPPPLSSLSSHPLYTPPSNTAEYHLPYSDCSAQHPTQSFSFLAPLPEHDQETGHVPASLQPSPSPRPQHNARDDSHEAHPSLQPASALDGPFLDFLYPAQTLAFMSRVSTTHLDRIWDRRAAHRASVTGSRGYSSMTPASSKPREPDGLDTFHHFAQNKPSHSSDAQSETHPPPEVTPKSLLQDQPPSLPQPRRQPLSKPRRPTISLQKPYDELMQMISDYPKSSGPLETSRAWDLYVTSSEDEQQNPALLSTFIVWLHRSPDPSVFPRILQLLARLENSHNSHKSIDVFRAAIAAYIHSGRIGRALEVRAEALTMLSDQTVGADMLMLHAVTGRNWDMALDLHRQLEPCPALNTADFHMPSWASSLHLAPDLYGSLLGLAARYKRAAAAQDDSIYAKELSGLVRSLVRATIRMSTQNPGFLAPTPAGSKLQAELRRFLKGIYVLKLRLPSLHEDCLIALCQLQNTGYLDRLLTLVAANYNIYRMSATFQPSHALLRHLLAFWKEFKLGRSTSGPRLHSISVDVLLSDMEKFYGRIDPDAIALVMDCFAQLGDVTSVESYTEKLRSVHPNPEKIRSSSYWPLVYVHAVNKNPTDAMKQLDRIRDDFGLEPTLRCWNIVIHAFAEANDLKGAVATLKRLLGTTSSLDPYSFTPVLTLYAKQGDVEQVERLIDLAKSRDVVPNGHMLNSLIVAHVNNDDIVRAEQVLEEAIQVLGSISASVSLTMCFNTIITAYALRRNINLTMTTYRRMKDENVKLDARTFGALLRVLCFYRQTAAARKILKTVMQASDVRPMAFHYAIVMSGYITQRAFQSVLILEKEMLDAGVRPNNSTRAMSFKAKASIEHTTTGGDVSYDNGSVHTPLETAIEDFKALLDDTLVSHSGSRIASDLFDRSEDSLLDADYLISIHGKRRAFDAAKEICNVYTTKTFTKADTLPIRLLTSLMSVYLRDSDYTEVDRYWNLALKQADAIRLQYAEQAVEFLPSHAQRADIVPNAKSRSLIPTASRFILSRPLRFYMASQFSQATVDGSSTIASLISSLSKRGFQLDNRTWNAYIVHLCRCSPPRVLLAFTLTEKLLIGNWPGWVNARAGVVSNKWIRPKRSVKHERVDYLRSAAETRYHAPGFLVPQYPTMVHLASALLELRGLQATGDIGTGAAGRNGTSEQRDIQQQVGTLREIRKKAPATLMAVQKMPKIDDKIQQKLMKKE